MKDEAEKQTQPLQRLKSRISGLDLILGGGFLQGGIYMIMGQPGAGKTILGNQICFGHVASGQRAAYVTLLAESHGRMLAHLSALRFFDRSPIPNDLCYISGYGVLEKDGLDGLLNLLRRVIQDQSASLLVIDGLITAGTLASSDLLLKKFIHELQVLVGVMGCTVLLLLNNMDREQPYPEYTMVDGILELSDQLFGMRAVRQLEVRKFRGSGFLRGHHVFDITDAGIEVYPRTEALFNSWPAAAPEDRTRLSSGVPRLDEMLRGGLIAGSTTLVAGPPGSGKTLLGAHFLCAGALAEQPSLYFGFYESPPRLIGKADEVGLDFSGHVGRGLIEVLWQPPIEQLIDRTAARLLQAIERRRVRRVVIDGLAGFRDATFQTERFAPFLVALTSELRARNVTILLIEEARQQPGMYLDLPAGGVSAIVENLIWLRFQEVGARLTGRLVAVRKVRESDHEQGEHEFRISDQGIQIARGAEG